MNECSVSEIISLPTTQLSQTLQTPTVKFQFIYLILRPFLSYHKHFSHAMLNFTIIKFHVTYILNN